MTIATDVLRRLLDERGVEWEETTTFIGATITDKGIERHYLVSTWWVSPMFGRVEATDMGDGVLHMACLNGRDFTPEQAIAATLGSSNCTDDERTNGTCRKVYLVETSDELIESWFPFGLYLHREAAEDCAEALRREDDGILCFARVSELKVVDE